MRPEPYDIMMDRKAEEEARCPHVIRKRAGDESYDICELNSKPCLAEHGLYECDIYQEYLEKLFY